MSIHTAYDAEGDPLRYGGVYIGRTGNLFRCVALPETWDTITFRRVSDEEFFDLKSVSEYENGEWRVTLRLATVEEARQLLDTAAPPAA